TSLSEEQRGEPSGTRGSRLSESDRQARCRNETATGSSSDTLDGELPGKTSRVGQRNRRTACGDRTESCERTPAAAAAGDVSGKAGNVTRDSGDEKMTTETVTKNWKQGICRGITLAGIFLLA